MPTKSEFAKWFRAQAGPAPCNPVQFQKLRLRVAAARSELERLEKQLQAAVLYNKAHQYALYAWCARDPLAMKQFLEQQRSSEPVAKKITDKPRRKK